MILFHPVSIKLIVLVLKGWSHIVPIKLWPWRRKLFIPVSKSWIVLKLWRVIPIKPRPWTKPWRSTKVWNSFSIIYFPFKWPIIVVVCSILSVWSRPLSVKSVSRSVRSIILSWSKPGSLCLLVLTLKRVPPISGVGVSGVTSCLITWNVTFLTDKWLSWGFMA